MAVPPASAIARTVRAQAQGAQAGLGRILTIIHAAAAGVELGDLVFINATQNSYGAVDTYGVMNSYTYEAKAMDRGTTIVSGDVSVSAEVILEYEFR